MAEEAIAFLAKKLGIDKELESDLKATETR